MLYKMYCIKYNYFVTIISAVILEQFNVPLLDKSI